MLLNVIAATNDIEGEDFVTPALRKSGESTEAFLWITPSNGRNKFGIANFLMRETKKKHRGELITFR